MNVLYALLRLIIITLMCELLHVPVTCINSFYLKQKKKNSETCWKHVGE